MNNKTRKEIGKMVETLEEYKGKLEEVNNGMTIGDIQEWLSDIAEYEETLEDINTRVSEIRDEEQEKLDNMPDSFRDSERGEKQEEVCVALENATYYDSLYSVEDTLTDLIEQVGEVIDYLNEAIG